MGEVEGSGALAGGKCIDCEEDLLKKGIEEGVSRLEDWRIEEVGLRGACGSEGAEAVWLVLTLVAVTGRLRELSGDLAARTYDGREEGEPIDENEVNEDSESMASG